MFPIAQAEQYTSQSPHVCLNANWIVSPGVQLLRRSIHRCRAPTQVVLQHVPLMSIPTHIWRIGVGRGRPKITQLQLAIASNEEVFYLNIPVIDRHRLRVQMGNRFAGLVEHPQHRVRGQVFLQAVVQRASLAQFRHQQVFRPLGGRTLGPIDEGRRNEFDDVRVAGHLLQGADLANDIVAFFLVGAEQSLQGVLVPGLDILCDEDERKSTFCDNALDSQLHVRYFHDLSDEFVVLADAGASVKIVHRRFQEVAHLARA